MIELTNANSVEHIADYIEFYTLYNNKSLPKSELHSMLKNVDDSVTENQTDSVLSEMIRRINLYGENSPFIIEGSIIRPVVGWKDAPELLMCLIFSLKGARQIRNMDNGTKLFERLSYEAVKLYLGGEGEIIGFPNAKHLEKQITNISKKTYETLGGRCPKPKDKDKGVDVIMWKSHGDKRSNQIVLLIQCGAGKNVLQKKQIPIKAWCQFIHWTTDPIPGLVIPAILSDEDWTDVSDDYNLIFDRVRIFKALRKNNFVNKNLRRDIVTWCTSNVS